MKINSNSYLVLRNFINLNILKKKSTQDNFVTIDIGFRLEPVYLTWINKFKKKFKDLKKELFFSSLFREFASYNFVLMILFFGLGFLLFAIINLNIFNEELGLNFSGDNNFDLLINKNYIFFIPILYISFFLLIIVIFYKFNLKFIRIFFDIFFFYILFISFVIFIALVQYLLYFES